MSMSTASGIRVFLAGFFLLLALLAVLTSRIREIRLREKEKRIAELGRRLDIFTLAHAADELKIKEYDAKILLRKLESRGRIKARREGGKEEYYIENP